LSKFSRGKIALALLAPGLIGPALGETSLTPKYAADVPAYITTPDTVETRIGTLKFNHGVPDKKTVQTLYDQIDFTRGIDTFLKGMPATSVHAICEGLDSVGAKRNQGVAITEDLMDARSLFLTANTTTVYVISCIDLKDGPIVMQVPPRVLGPADDADFRWATDVGLTGPDAGRGGKYLFVPPGYSGALPAEGHFMVKPRTNGLLVFYRAFVKGGDLAGAVRNVKDHARVYPLHGVTESGDPPATVFTNISGLKFNTISSNTFRFYEELNAVVQNEPADFVDPNTVGLFAAIGIKKGEPFAPDARMKAILTDAVAVGNAYARTNLFASRDKQTRIYADRQWLTPFVGGSYEFLSGAERLLDAEAMFFYYATGITPAMTMSRVGTGSAYAVTMRDATGNGFDGAKTYKVELPAPIPAKDFWSFVVYDNETRSLLETDQRSAGVDSNAKGLKKNADGSVTLWFGPTAPAGQENNWIQTIPGKGWNTTLRLYGPLEPWFNQSWKPGDIELVND
jgi:hypothetical protein